MEGEGHVWPTTLEETRIRPSPRFVLRTIPASPYPWHLVVAVRWYGSYCHQLVVVEPKKQMQI